MQVQMDRLARLSHLECMLFGESEEPKALPLSLLEDITNGFSDEQEIGSGGFAVVYKGDLQSRTIAVKKLCNTHMHEKEFHREVECLMNVKHKNIVRFLGYCDDTQGNMEIYNGKLVMAGVHERLLCFEYLPEGSLDKYITDASSGLEWRKRYQIIKGICEGLCYLHKKRIVHLDLKPANILLDSNMVPKIADFGLSRCFDENQTRTFTKNQIGSMGYLAAEFYSGLRTLKSDIYSLGIIITEILTGYKGYSDISNVLESWRNRLKTQLGEAELEQIKVCATIGTKCTEYNPEKRPNIEDVIHMLRQTEMKMVDWVDEDHELRTQVKETEEDTNTCADSGTSHVSAAPSEIPPSVPEQAKKAYELQQVRAPNGPVEISHEISSVSDLADKLRSMAVSATPSEIRPSAPEQAEKAYELILENFYSESQAMRMILNKSYADLRLPLKSCFLYFTAFSRNYDIKKDRLIRRWVAEGLIPERHGKSSWESGESYFDELISRRLIQPAFDDNDDQPIGCTVHSVILDFLEESFVTAGAELKNGLFPCERVRRVSLDCGDEDEGDTLISSTYCLLEQKSLVASSRDEDEDDASFLNLSRVRSLAFSGDAGRIPDLSAFKHLLVLDFEGTKGLENIKLEGIGHLSLLRYLGLGGTDVTKLPQQIMALEQLTTLDLRRTRVRRLPEFRDTKLVSVLADELVITPREMRRMQNLEELSKVLLGPDGSLADELAGHVNKLGPLRMLGIRFSHFHRQNETDRQGVKRFLEELGKSNLQSLLLDNYLHPLLDLLVGSWAHNLRKFELRIRSCLPRVPQEIASLIAVTHLHINVEAVEAQAVRALGSLPNLVLLKVHLNTSPSMTVSSKDGFQCLRVLWYNSQYGGGKGMQFEAGAMPQLRRLRLDLDAQETKPKHDDFDFGIHHLSYLVQVHATIDWKNTLTPSEVEAAEAQIREQVSRNPNNPVLELNRRKHPHIAKAAEELVITVNSLHKWSKQIDTRRLVVVHFSAGWCIASRKISPVFADLAKKFQNVVFLKVDVDVDEMKNVAVQFRVLGVPTFLVMKGGYVKDRVLGAYKEELEEKLEEQADLMLEHMQQLY